GSPPESRLLPLAERLGRREPVEGHAERQAREQRARHRVRSIVLPQPWSFNIGRTSEIIGVRGDRLQCGHVKGLLAPSIARQEVQPPRPGSVGRRYSLDDLVLAVAIRELLASEVSVEHVHEAMGGITQTVIDRPLHVALSRWMAG